MVDLTIRVPVIPTFNATPEEIYDIAMFAASLKVSRNFIYFHTTDSDKANMTDG